MGWAVVAPLPAVLGSTEWQTASRGPKRTSCKLAELTGSPDVPPELQHHSSSEPCLPDSMLCLPGLWASPVCLAAFMWWQHNGCIASGVSKPYDNVASLTLPQSPALLEENGGIPRIGMHISCAATAALCCCLMQASAVQEAPGGQLRA